VRPRNSDQEFLNRPCDRAQRVGLVNVSIEMSAQNCIEIQSEHLVVRDGQVRRRRRIRPVCVTTFVRKSRFHDLQVPHLKPRLGQAVASSIAC